MKSAARRCRAKYHGKRCERQRWHRGFHRVATSPTSDIEWATLDRLIFWKEKEAA